MDKLEAQKTALREMVKWGLVDDGWTFGWLSRRATQTCGQCVYRAKAIRLNPRHVELNSPVVVLDTVRHEIAHALVGSRANHGPAWRECAVRVGATPERAAGEEVAPVPRQPFRWTATCRDCGAVMRRRQLTKKAISGGLRHRGCESELRWERIVTDRWHATCPDCGETLRAAGPSVGAHCRSTLVWTED